MRSHRLALAAAGCAAAVLGLAGPASAADNITQEVVSFAPDVVVATCSNGDQIGLGFDLVRNIHLKYDDSGNLITESRNVNFLGIFADLTTGERYTFRGTRHSTLDFVAGTFTFSGNYRTVTQPGNGTVLHSAGREVFDLINEVVLFDSGPKYDELSQGAEADICGLFGLTA